MSQRILLIVFIALAVCVDPVFAQTRFPFLGETVSDRVNVRAGQSNSFESIAALKKAAQLVVTGKSYSWYKVQLPDGVKAFIKAEYVILVTPEIGEVNADRVNVRATPNTNASILGQLKKGKKFFIKEKQGDWFWMKPVEELTGWIHQSLIVFKSNQIPAVPLPDPDVLASRKAAELKAQAAKAIERLSLIKRLDNGQVECSGSLLKADGGLLPYKVVRDNMTACLVDGSAAVMDNFLNRDVKVQGALKSQGASSEFPIVVVSKISLLL